MRSVLLERVKSGKACKKIGKYNNYLAGEKEGRFFMKTIDVNEIVVQADQTPGQVNFYNFEELKKYISKGLSVYNTTDYTVDNIKQAEEDLADLKKIKKKLTDRKKELETAYSMPIEEVKQQLDELLKMVKEPIDYNGLIN